MPLAAPDSPVSSVAAFDDDAWEDLLNYIEEKRVIPIVGPEAHSGMSRANVRRRIDQPKARHTAEFAAIQRHEAVAMPQRRRRHEQIMGTDHMSPLLQDGPNFRVLPRGPEVEIEHGNPREHRLDKSGALVLSCGRLSRTTPCSNSEATIEGRKNVSRGCAAKNRPRSIRPFSVAINTEVSSISPISRSPPPDCGAPRQDRPQRPPPRAPEMRQRRPNRRQLTTGRRAASFATRPRFSDALARR